MRDVAGALLAMLLVLASLSAPAAADVVTLTVTVVDQDGNPVSGADLEASWDGGSSTATTASNGKAFLDVDAGADVSISVDHPDYVRNRNFTVEDADEEDVEVPVWERGELTVTVRNETGTLAGADVRFTKDQLTQHASTDEDGVLRTGPIEQGTYTVRAVHPGYFENTTTVEVDGEVTTTITLEAGRTDIDFTVVDEYFDPPQRLNNVRVRVFQDGTEIASATTSNGEAGVDVPVNTRLRVVATKDGYVQSERPISVGEREEQFDITMSRTPEITVTALSNRIVANETTIIEATDEYDDPVGNATVQLDGDPVGETDPDGEYRLSVEEPGEYTVSVERDGLTSDPLDITVVPATTATPTATETETGTPTETTGGVIPGFTAGLAVLALAVAALLAHR